MPPRNQRSKNGKTNVAHAAHVKAAKERRAAAADEQAAVSQADPMHVEPDGPPRHGRGSSSSPHAAINAQLRNGSGMQRVLRP